MPIRAIRGSHIPRNHRLHAKSARRIFFIPIAQRHGARLPASTVITTPQRTARVEEAMLRILHPAHRLPPACHHHARPLFGTPTAHRHRRRQVHQTCHRAKHPRCMMHQPHQLPQRRPPTKIEHILQCRMVMPTFPHLHKQDAPLERIHHRLPPLRRPPFDRIVILPACTDNPIRQIRPVASIFVHGTESVRIALVSTASNISHGRPQAGSHSSKARRLSALR